MYLSNRYFTDGITSSERYSILEPYSGIEWRFILDRVDTRRHRISAPAVRVAAVMKEKLGIVLFPLIIPVACKGFDISGGTLAFLMYGKNGEEYGFEDRAKTYKSMSADYTLNRWYGTNVIGRVYKKK